MAETLSIQHQSDPTFDAIAVTPSNTTVFPRTPRGIYVGLAGDLAVVLPTGAAITFTNLIPGIIHPIRPSQVLFTGTTSGEIIAVF